MKRPYFYSGLLFLSITSGLTLLSQTTGVIPVVPVVVTPSSGNETSTVPPTLFGISGGGAVELGQEIALRVSFAGTGSDQSYQWRKNSADIAGATSVSYTIPAAVAADAATYTVTVSNAAGTSVASTSVTVKALAAPVVTSSPSSQTVSVGQAVTFSFAATGSYPRTHQWLKNGVAINGATGPTYGLASVVTGDAGTYSVMVTNSQGSVTSASASLTVNAASPPMLSTSYPFDATYVQGSSMSLSVSITSGSSPFAYQWRKAGVPIAGATAPQLTFGAVTLADTGKYSVTVTNIAGSATSREATLTVTAAIPVSISFQPRPVTVFPGQSASFSISYNGSSPITFQWLKNGAPITGATFSSYTINAVAATDAGSYSVVVTNSAGPVTSSAAALTVSPPVAPAITTQPVDVTITEGSSASFSVTASGSPQLNYQWYLNGIALANSNSSTFYLSSGSSMAGKYRVSVTNGAGTVTSTEATLVILPPPPPPAVSLNNSTAQVGTSLTLSAYYAGTGNVATTYQWYRNGKSIPQATQSSLTVGSVKADDAGSYFVVVTNSSGSTTSRTAQVTVTPAATTSSGAWLAVDRQGDIAYFAFSNPARIERFNLAADAWLPAINLGRAPTALAVAGDALYVAFGSAISRYALDGTGEIAFSSGFPGNITGLVICNGFLIAAQNNRSQVTSVRLSDGVKVGTNSTGYYWAPEMSVASGSGRIFSHTTGVSPSDITVMTLQPGGTLSTATDSPYHGDYITGTRSFVFPGETYVADDSGTIYFTANLAFAGGLGGKFDDLAFTATGDPVVLRGGVVRVYDSKFNETVSLDIGSVGVRLFVRGDDIYVFGYPPAGGSIAKTRLAFSQSRLRPVLASVDPAGLSFTPDTTFIDRDGTVFLFSRLYGQLFRWSPSQRRFLASIPLQGWPNFVTYSAVTHRVYLGYADKRITQIQLDAGSVTEQPFASAPEDIMGLITVGQHIFLCDPTGAWVSYYIFAPDGRLVTRREWSYFGADYVWSPATRRVYQFRDDSSPNDLLYTEVNADGTLGTQKDSPYHGEIATRYPIRVSPDGSTVLLGSGKFFDGTTMLQNNSLPSAIDDAAWVNNRVITARGVLEGVELQRWGGNNYALDRTARLPGRLIRLHALSGDRLLAVTLSDGLVYFTVYDQNLSPLSTDFGGLPSRLANISTRSQIGSSEQIMISGFYIAGTQPKSVLIRAAGPTLAAFGLAGNLADPVLTLFNSSGVAIASNDNWGTNANLTALSAAATRVGAFAFAGDSRDSAMLVALEPGAYTAQVRGLGGATGVALVEVYDALDNIGDGRLVNLATRAWAGAGGDVLIAGVVVTGTTPKKILIRATGPALTAFGVPGALADPLLKVFKGDVVIGQNDNWSASASEAALIAAAGTATGAFALSPGAKDAAILITLEPGAYTIQISGVGVAEGTALVEAYEAP